MKGEKSPFIIPVIPNIHQQVLAAVSNPGALDMSSWHTCDTTHCRAGWVIHLAGEAGYELEKKTDPIFAAMQIYKKSSAIHVGPNKFFENNEGALQDMERCAKAEAELVENK